MRSTVARIIPKVDVASIVNGGERIIAMELVRQLSESCVVYHSYPWLSLTRSDYSRRQFLQPGEADFIVVDPDNGLLVLEVKGGTIEYDPLTHEFFRVHDRGGRERIQNPFDQAARNLYAPRDMILAHENLRGETSLPFAHGYAVAFPHCVYSGSLPPDAEREIVFSANDIPDLANKVRAALAVWSRTGRVRPIDANLRDAIQESLSPIFKLTPVLWRTVEDQEEKAQAPHSRPGDGARDAGQAITRCYRRRCRFREDNPGDGAGTAVRPPGQADVVSLL
jgi:hypothetical protein